MLRSGRGVAIVAVITAIAVALAANTVAVNSATRAAMARSGGTVMETGVVPANVKVEGEGPPIVLIHGFGAALDWWDEIAPQLATDHRVIRLDLIGHGGTEAPGVRIYDRATSEARRGGPRQTRR
jgi:pimeloyl-ACP methyl ester carboxylesterase